MSAVSNPFATRFITPGATEYVQNVHSPCGLSRDTVCHSQASDYATKFAEAGFVAQIIGPHGTGKSSLAIEIARHLKRDRDQVQRLVIRRVGFFRFAVQKDGSENSHQTLVLLDGIERLSVLHRYCLIQSCVHRQQSVLVTSHRKLVGIPILARTVSSFEQFQMIVDRLMENCIQKFEQRVVQKAFDQSGGDYREGLMWLYDVFQDRYSKPSCPESAVTTSKA